MAPIKAKIKKKTGKSNLSNIKKTNAVLLDIL
jgi:hypothetical protein